MDNVQTYYLFLLVINIFLAGFFHGKPCEGDHDSRIDFLGLALMIPVIGRVFNWW